MATSPAVMNRLPTNLSGDEFITPREFGKRVTRSMSTVYRWLQNAETEMPPGSVVMIHGNLRVNWTVFAHGGVKSVH